MKNVKLFTFCLILLLSIPSKAQGLVDGFFSSKNSLSLTASYTYSTYDEFYVGTEKVSPVPAHNSIDQNIYGLYAKYGLSDNLTLIGNLPYISTKGNGMPDPINSETKESGFQDVSIFAKYRPYSFEMTKSNINLVTALGVNIPTGYEPNGVLSIGSGAFSTDIHLGAHLNTDLGFFSTFIAGYSFRGNAKNTFNTNGGGDFNVPNAFIAAGKIGYAGSDFYLEGWIDYQSSSDGIDIMGPGFAGNLPETRVDYTRLGATAYVPLSSLLGLSAGYGTVVDGRNVGDSNFFNAGITFNLNTSETGTPAVNIPVSK